jgi:CelD/BcsL family acetyltransferase involved in cellulose biosynthesis
MEVRLVDSVQMFEALRDQWDALLESSPNVSVFVTWEWNYLWWRHYSKNRRLHIVTAWEDGRLMGILPLYIQRSAVYRIFAVNVARFIGTGGDTAPDYLGPLLRPDRADRTATALVDYLFDGPLEWDVLHMSDLQAGTAFWATFMSCCARRRCYVGERIAADISFITLPASWDDYLASLHRDRRYAIRSARRKFETQHRGRFYVRAGEEGLDDAVDHLISLHHRRWEARSERHAFSSLEYVGFHRDVIHACARRGWIRFYVLEADGAPVAVFYCYRFREQIYYFQAGFDPAYERLRPGLILIGYAVEHAIQEGNTVFDFLRGEHHYKTQWGKSKRRTYTLTAHHGGVGSALFRVREERLPSVKAWIKRALPFLRRGRPASHEGASGRPNA